MMPSADEWTDYRAVFAEAMPDRARILIPARPPSTGQPGRRGNSTPTVRAADVPCSTFTSKATSKDANGNTVTILAPMVRLPANTPLQNSDQIEVTSAATGSVITYAIVDIGRRSTELSRVIAVREAGTIGAV